VAFAHALLALPFAAPFLELRIPDDAPEQRNAAPLEVLPVQRLWDFDGTDIGHGDGFRQDALSGAPLGYPIRSPVIRRLRSMR
jgi:hypothetical protein